LSPPLSEVPQLYPLLALNEGFQHVQRPEIPLEPLIHFGSDNTPTLDPIQGRILASSYKIIAPAYGQNIPQEVITEDEVSSSSDSDDMPVDSVEQRLKVMQLEKELEKAKRKMEKMNQRN
jgi:hypothetical protein